MDIEKQSILTGEVRCRDIPVTEEQLARFRNGIPGALAGLSAEDREFIVSGVTPEEAKEFFRREFRLSSMFPVAA